jgi:hypothetical protein
LNNEASIKLYQSIADANETREFKHWHASSIAECPRAHWMKRKGVKATNIPSAALMLRWNAGHAFEEIIRPHIPKLFDVNFEPIRSNVRLTSEKLDLTGEYDNFSVDNDTLIEVKTVHDYAFVDRDGHTYLKEKTGTNSRGQNTWGIKNTPYLHHELQNHCYTLLLNETGIEVKAIKYVYISLSGRIVVYDTVVQEELLDNIHKRLEVLNKAWDSDSPPPCICESTHPLYDSVMQYCDYKDGNNCCVIKGEK